ncbi:hypothetical protein ELQ35_08300 [Peribacillus cavernae]|uniref:Lipoprotein n=1 Tax=Peribacillus cavernae TaxID=1674310 RepID=A0A3S0UFG6_9BACI|nr:hypothetical protein [Peribacillus cavernae]MDQ0217199.1 hypothetical protein [Peribacillus cavernae]RUQ30330.1 hypothetical protein ELQ35_08300 [Peribacillus cavernae]
MRLLISLFTLLLIVSACGRNIPEPENKEKKIGLLEHSTASAASIQSPAAEDFDVKYFVKGNFLYVDCFLKDFSFSPSTKKQQAIVRLYMDGRKVNDYNTAAFIVRTIPEGKHQINLEILDKNGKPAGLEKKFIIEINSDI